MNYPQRAMLRILGVLLFLAGLIISIFFMSSVTDIRMADNICKAQLNVYGQDVPIGYYAQIISDSEADCSKAHFLRIVVDYAWILLVVGAILFFVGVWAGLGARQKKEIVGSK